MRTWGRGRRQGLSLFSALLALGLFGLVVVSVGQQLEIWAFDKRQRQAGEQLIVLFRAAATLSAHDYTAGRNTALAQAGQIEEVSITGLRSANLLPLGFSEVNALGQGYRIFRRAFGRDGLEIVVTTVTPSGSPPVYNLVAPGEHTDNIALGMVSPVAGARLRGPGVDMDISAYQTQFAGALGAGELAAIDVVTLRGTVGSVLHRLTIDGHTGANIMETDIDMDGNDITGAATIEATTLTVDDEIRALGGMKIMADLIVGKGLTVNGETTMTEKMTADTVQVTNTMKAGTVDVSGRIEAARAIISDQADFGKLDVRGAFTSQTATMDTLVTTGLSAKDVSATTLTTETTQADRMNTSRLIVEETAAVKELYVGSCSGC